MKLQNKALITLKGEPLKEVAAGAEPKGDEPVVTVATVLMSVCMRQRPPNQPYTGAEVQGRFKAARYLADLDIGVPFSLESDLVVQLKKDVIECYGPLVAGQMVDYLEGEGE